MAHTVKQRPWYSRITQAGQRPHQGIVMSLRFAKWSLQTDFIVASCDLVCDYPLHLLADIHRVNDAAVRLSTMVYSS